jgi:hypothetical protein
MVSASIVVGKTFFALVNDSIKVQRRSIAGNALIVGPKFAARLTRIRTGAAVAVH